MKTKTRRSIDRHKYIDSQREIRRTISTRCLFDSSTAKSKAMIDILPCGRCQTTEETEYRMYHMARIGRLCPANYTHYSFSALKNSEHKDVMNLLLAAEKEFRDSKERPILFSPPLARAIELLACMFCRTERDMAKSISSGPHSPRKNHDNDSAPHSFNGIYHDSREKSMITNPEEFKPLRSASNNTTRRKHTCAEKGNANVN